MFYVGLCVLVFFVGLAKLHGVPKKIVDNELFTPGDDNNTQQQYSTSGPIFGPFCDKLYPFLSISPEKMSTPYTQ